MTRKLKPLEVELDQDIQLAVLSLPMVSEDGTVATIGSLLDEAQRLLDQARNVLEHANLTIRDNALVQALASTLMKEQKRRGEPLIQALIDRRVVLRISYGDEPELIEPAPPPAKLPSLSALRDRAEGLEVDISDLGRRKRLIVERLDAAEQGSGEAPLLLRDEVSETTLLGSQAESSSHR